MKAACILFTATVVLFVLVNLLAAYVYPHDTRAVVSGHPVFNEATRATYERIYQLPISVIREVGDECWSERSVSSSGSTPISSYSRLGAPTIPRQDFHLQEHVTFRGALGNPG